MIRHSGPHPPDLACSLTLVLQLTLACQHPAKKVLSDYFSMTISNAPRLWLIDDNIVGTGGHFLELASLLAAGGKDLGYAPRLAVHQNSTSSMAI